MRGKDRAELRAEAHHLRPTVHVGHQGITPTLLRSLDEALAARELVKVQVERNAPASVKEIANSLASDVGAEVVQVIGRKTTLYRHNPELPQEPDAPPGVQEAQTSKRRGSPGARKSKGRGSRRGAEVRRARKPTERPKERGSPGGAYTHTAPSTLGS